MIPVAAPLAAYHRYRAEFDSALNRVMASGRYILGPEVAAFEAEFAGQFDLGNGIGVASGTEALWLALRGGGVERGGDVIVPALTASATVAAVVEAGCRPVFADVSPGDLNLDPDDLAARVTPRTRAVVAVHLYGHPADLTTIQALCQSKGLVLVEDCAQAHGASHAGSYVGRFGAAAAWSFYPTKNLGAFGDGGLVSTRDAGLAAELRLLREYGWRERYHSANHGWNSRLDEIQAALLRVRLAHLEADNQRRRAIAARYRAALPERLSIPVARPGDISAEHLFAIRHPRRDSLRQALLAAGIGTAVHYPVPCHLQAAYRQFGSGQGSLPVAERAAAELISLPMYPELSDVAVERVITATLHALEQMSLP